MNSDEILALYRQGQCETLAFELESVSLNHLAETLAAFANTNGGIVLFGVDPKGGAVRGIRAGDSAIEKALAAGLRCEPPLILPRPESAPLDRKKYSRFTVNPRKPHPSTK